MKLEFVKKTVIRKVQEKMGDNYQLTNDTYWQMELIDRIFLASLVTLMIFMTGYLLMRQIKMFCIAHFRREIEIQRVEALRRNISAPAMVRV